WNHKNILCALYFALCALISLSVVALLHLHIQDQSTKYKELFLIHRRERDALRHRANAPLPPSNASRQRSSRQCRGGPTALSRKLDPRERCPRRLEPNRRAVPKS